MSINFPLRTAFAVSNRFWEVVLSFSLNYRNFFTSSLISSMSHWSWNNVLLSFQLFDYFLLLPLLLNSNFIALLSDSIVCRGIWISYIFQDLLCDLNYGLFWRKFHGLLRKMYTVLLLNVIFCRCLSGPLDLWCHLIPEILCWFFFVWMTYLLEIEE
jgi:hypothetical protein